MNFMQFRIPVCVRSALLKQIWHTAGNVLMLQSACSYTKTQALNNMLHMQNYGRTPHCDTVRVANLLISQKTSRDSKLLKPRPEKINVIPRPSTPICYFPSCHPFC